MARYRTATRPEAEQKPGSGGRVLRNLLGITSKRAIEQAEYAALVRAQSEWLSKIGPKTQFGAAVVCEMHADWLGGTYEWAGHYRTVEVAKGDFPWSPAHRVAANMTSLEQGLLREHTPRLPASLSEVAASMAKVHAELLLIYPFRDGNGRIARRVADGMAFQAELPAPDYGFTGQGARSRRAHYLAAVRKAYSGDYEDLRGFFPDALERRRAGSG